METQNQGHLNQAWSLGEVPYTCVWPLAASSSYLPIPMHSHCGDIFSGKGVGRVADQQTRLPHGTVERGSAHVDPGPSLRPFFPHPQQGQHAPTELEVSLGDWGGVGRSLAR